MRFPFSDRGKSASTVSDDIPVNRVLLVEDEPLLLTNLADFIGSQEFKVECACNGSQAISILGQGNVDIVVLDLNLGPSDVGGYGVLDFIADQKIDVVVVVISGLKTIESAIGALQRGVYDYLQKPFTRDALLKTLFNAMRHRCLQRDNKRISELLEQSEQSYRYLVDNSPDLIYTLDGNGFITFINNRVQHLLGYTCEELIGQHFSKLVFEDDLRRAHTSFKKGVMDSQRVKKVELRFRLKHKGPESELLSFSNELMLVDTGMKQSQTSSSGPVFSVLGMGRDVTDRKRVEEQLLRQANYDTLTDLPNRALFKDRLGMALLQSKRKKATMAVMFIDLDRFKLVNDTLGHVVGDELLKQTSVRLRNCLRSGDTLARQGGDEFTAVLPELASREDACKVAEKILESLEPPFSLSGQSVRISASIGISIYPDDGTSKDDLLRNADMAMYHAKDKGKSTYAFFNPSLQDAANQRVLMEQSLHEAIAKNELEMYYQPQVDVSSNRVVGVEALMRWNHPQRGFLGAGEFLPFAEEAGLMIPMTDWMLNAICKDLHAWNNLSSAPLKMSLNLSPQYLDNGDFCSKLEKTLIAYGIEPSQIEVEVTENISIRNPESAIEQLKELRKLGVSVAIDDFGIGYSSLSYLHRFPVSTLKIDRAFVMQVQDADSQNAVILAIISIAKSLGLKLVAEGVENEFQVNYLLKLGCTTMQGYYYHRPLSNERMIELQGAEETQVVAV